MIVTIDGPAGAGKSSVSRQLAQRLGFRFLDTGAMYRAMAWAALRNGVAWQDREELEAVASAAQLEFTADLVLVDGVDVTQAIRTPEVTAAIHNVADNPHIRGLMVDLQRQLANAHDTVTEGRDQGTVAFPHAECKIYLTATPAERARRRHSELKARGEEISYAEVLAQNAARDHRDRTRAVGRLIKADEAVEVYTDGMTTEQVIDRLEAIVNQARNK
jgi:cytidylate kinase